MSKSRSLPLNEIANLFGRPDDYQARKLSQFVQPIGGRIPSYQMSKRAAAEAYGATGPLLPTMPGVSPEVLFRYLTSISRGDLGNRDFNWPIIVAMAEHAQSEGISARYREFGEVPLIGTHRKALVSNAVLVWDGKPTMICLDPRRDGYLSGSGILVVQSLIHHMLREQYPDLADMDIAVLQFFETGSALPLPAGCAPAETGKGVTRRKLVAHRLGEKPPIPYEELKSGIRFTLELFDKIVSDFIKQRRSGRK